MTTGREPQSGQGVGMPDFAWLLGLAGGDNHICQTVTAFAGGGQASATQMGIPNSQGVQAAFINIGTVGSAGDSVMLPQAIKGKFLIAFNSTANSADVFADPDTNRATGSTDTINALTNVTAYALAAGARALFFCPVDGKWASVLSA